MHRDWFWLFAYALVRLLESLSGMSKGMAHRADKHMPQQNDEEEEIENPKGDQTRVPAVRDVSLNLKIDEDSEYCHASGDEYVCHDAEESMY